MKVVIVEDEASAAQHLETALMRCASDAEVVARLRGVEETVEWLRREGPPDLMFLDIQLSDGLSWDIFDAGPIVPPVIFTTAFDRYPLEAFASNGIEYLLKPVEVPRLAQALEKFRQLRSHFQRTGEVSTRRRQRFLVRRGTEYLSIPINQISYFYTEYRLTFLVDQTGSRYLLEESLSQIEEQVNPGDFFRVNRQHLVSLEAIVLFRSGRKGQIELEVRHGPKASRGILTISQERAADFRRWIDR